MSITCTNHRGSRRVLTDADAVRAVFECWKDLPGSTMHSGLRHGFVIIGVGGIQTRFEANDNNRVSQTIIELLLAMDTISMMETKRIAERLHALLRTRRHIDTYSSTELIRVIRTVWTGRNTGEPAVLEQLLALVEGRRLPIAAAAA